jgi:short-subunit dehydrogenase
MGYSDSIRAELKSRKIRVACFEPGHVRTPLAISTLSDFDSMDLTQTKFKEEFTVINRLYIYVILF